MIAVHALPILALGTVAPADQPISIPTALLVIFGFALLWMAKTLGDLKRQVDHLAAAPRPRPTAPVPAAPATIPPEIIVVITAAVHEAIAADHRIVAISTESQNTGWSAEGRRQIFATRKVR